MPLTVEELYEKYIEEDKSFGVDVWELFGEPTGREGKYPTGEAWAQDWGAYLPAFDPAKMNLKARERDLAFRDAEELQAVTNIAAENVYATEVGGIGSKLESEVSKGRELAGRLGLKTGGLETVIEDTLASSGNKVKDLGDRLDLVRRESKSKYDATVAETTLDYDIDEHQAKQAFYDKTLAMINTLVGQEAFISEEAPSMCCSKPLYCNVPTVGPFQSGGGVWECGSQTLPCGSEGCEGECYKC